jgi:hypothetical protein
MLRNTQAENVVIGCINATAPGFGGDIEPNKKIRQVGIVSVLLRLDLIDRIVNSADGVIRYNHRIDPQFFVKVTINTTVGDLVGIVLNAERITPA